MLDIKYIRENKDQIVKAVENKGIDLNLEKLIELDKERVRLIQDIEELKSLKNDLNYLIQNAKTDEEKAEEIEKGKEIKLKLESKEPEYQKIKEEFDKLMVSVPTIPSPDTPVGKSEEENMEVLRSGTIPKFDFVPKDHITLGKELDILDFERGAKVAGYRGYYLKNEGATLAMALMMYALNKMVEKGFSPMIPPTLVKDFSLFGSGYFKGTEYDGEVDEIYQVASSDKEADGKKTKDKKFLVGTAEPSLLAYYSGEVLKEEQLPMKLCGYSQCYRSEIGSYGKDTKGLYRVHEFMKVEQVILAKANIEESSQLQEEMLDISKEMLEEIGLPYRQLQICTGDMSPGKYRMFDLEVWIPSREGYGESGSASNFLDWQSRRLNVKYTDQIGEKRYVYMLNNTALATPRVFIAILENFQQADGSVKIPEVLRKWMPGNIKNITKK
jgi:seryl-tRNA synthetase